MLLGDRNFIFYFEASHFRTVLYLEDSRKTTLQAYNKLGFGISRGVAGISKIKQMIEALQSLDRDILKAPAIFVIDNDQGIKEVKHLVGDEVVPSVEGFSIKRVIDLDNAYFLILPKNMAAEDLYDELDSEKDVVLNEVLNLDLSVKTHPRSDLSTLVTSFRHNKPLNREVAKARMRNDADFKAYFWKRVEDKGYSISPQFTKAIKSLIDCVEKLIMYE